ncbi:hypothetical protein KO02_01420 [Sphingobacterium sp. ML3W]|nr:hypothetical protein KO02_01420 [Sphingobacterium sp. ML3W]
MAVIICVPSSHGKHIITALQELSLREIELEQAQRCLGVALLHPQLPLGQEGSYYSLLIHAEGEGSAFTAVVKNDRADTLRISLVNMTVYACYLYALCYAWLNRYVGSLKGRKEVIIDVDATDDSTYGKQQLSMFNGYYGHFMLNELFFHDGQTGQIILPVLRPGNSNSTKWYVGILRRVVKKIRASYPEMKIIIRTDSGFSCASFYKLVDAFTLYFVTGQAGNPVFKKKSRAKRSCC